MNIKNVKKIVLFLVIIAVIIFIIFTVYTLNSIKNTLLIISTTTYKTEIIASSTQPDLETGAQAAVNTWNFIVETNTPKK